MKIIGAGMPYPSFIVGGIRHRLPKGKGLVALMVGNQDIVFYGVKNRIVKRDRAIVSHI